MNISYKCLRPPCRIKTPFHDSVFPSKFLLSPALTLRDSTIYNEYISFCGLDGSKSSVNGVSNCLNPCNSVGFVGSTLRISQTLLLRTCALVCGM